MDRSRGTRTRRTTAFLLLVLTLVAALLAPMGVTTAAAVESETPVEESAPAAEPREPAALRGLGQLSAVSGNGTIRGLVHDQDGNLVDGVAVEAIPWEQPDADPVATAITYEWGDSASHGAYELEVPAGEYLVRFGTGYDYWDDTAWETVYYGGGSGTKVTVGVDEEVVLDAVTVRPDAGTTLTGTVLTSTGAPLSGGEVALVRTTRTGFFGWYTVDWTTTDAQGRYTFTGVNRGQRYTVRAYGGWLDGPGNSYVDDADTFLGSKALFADATHVTVPTGSTGVTLPTFGLVPGTTITGKVVDQDGKPLGQWTELEVLGRTASGDLEYLRYAWGEEAGEFTGHRVPRDVPITLYVYGPNRFLGDVDDAEGATYITIPSDQATFAFGDVVFAQTGRLVTGRLVTPEGDPVEEGSVSLLTLDPDDPNDYVRSRHTQTDTDGGYRFFAPFGTAQYTLRAYDEGDGEYVYLGGVRDQASAVRFTAAQDDPPYAAEDLVVSTWGSRIRGVVTDEDGQPVAGATVRLHTDSWWGWEIWDSETTNAEGRYVFRWVDPGMTYVVGASRTRNGIEVFAGEDGTVTSRDAARQITPTTGQIVSGVDVALFTPVDSISGTVLLPAGDTLSEDAWSYVTLYRWVDYGEGDGYWEYAARRYGYDGDLAYGFGDLEPGSYYVEAEVEEYSWESGGHSPYLRTTSNGTFVAPTGPGEPGTLTLPEQGPGVLDVTMSPGVPLTGTVTLAGSDPALPLGDVSISVQDADYSFSGWAHTRANGRYEVRVPANLDLDVQAYRVGLEPLQETVASGSDGATLDLALEPRWGPIGDGPTQPLDYCLAGAGDSEHTLGGVDLRVRPYGYISSGSRYVSNPLAGRIPALAPLTHTWADASSGLSPDGDTLCVVWNDTYEDGPGEWWGQAYQALITVDPDGGFDVTFNYDQVDWTGTQSKAGHSSGLAPFEPVVRFPDDTAKGEDLRDWMYDEDWNQVPNPRALASNSAGSDVPGRYVFDFDGFHLGTAPQATTKPTIVGEPSLGQTLSVEPPTWAVDGVATDEVPMTYHWRVNGRPVATGPTYTPQQADLGGRIIVRARGYVPGRKLGSVYSKRRRIQAEPVATSTAPPSIVGTPAVGVTVSAEAGTWEYHPDVDPEDVTSRFEWLVGGSESVRSTGPTFQVPAWAAGQALRVRQRLTAYGHAPAAATSAPVAVPQPTPVTNSVAPSLSVEDGGDLRVGSILRVAPGTWDPADASFEYRWSVGGLQRAGGETYTVGQQDQGKRVAVRVTATAPGRSPSSLSTSVGPVLAAEENTATITGTVREDNGTPVVGADWSACGETANGGWSCFPGGQTDSAGGFTLSAPVGMTLWVTVWDQALGSQSRSLTVPAAGEAITFTYTRPTPPPPNVSVPSTSSTHAGVPSVYYGEAQTFEVSGCVTVDPRWDVVFANGATPMAGAMTKVEDLAGGLARYRAVIPAFYPNHDFATVSFTVPADCAPGTPPTKVVIYIDPSGIVTDQYGTPLVGASVTLLRSDTSGGQFTTVPTGDTSVMDPDAGLVDGAPGSGAQNPKPTDATGFFRWDVVEGFYKVRVNHTGCTELTTNEMQVNPPRVDLMVKLQCAGAEPPAAGATISGATDGTATAGTVLTAHPVAVTAPRTSRLQWLRNGSPILGATGTTYTVTGDDVGNAIRVRHTAQAPDYIQEEGRGATVTFDGSTAQSEAVTGVQAPAPVATVMPGITGTAKTGGTLTATNGQWNTTGLTFTHQWLRDGAPIQGATASSYAVVADDVGLPLAVRVTASKPGTDSGTATSESVTPTLGDAPTATTAPAITGTAKTGGSLTATNGQWSTTGLSFSRQWLRAGTPIAGATGTTYQVTPDDVGQALTVAVTATKAGFSDGTAASGAVTPTVGDAPTATTAPAVTGTPKVGATLTASSGTWSQSGVSHRYQWLRNGTAISGATSTTYKVVVADAATALSVRVTASRAGYADGQSTSAARKVPKIATATAITAPKKVTAGKLATVRITVSASGVTPTGKVKVFVGKKAVKTLTLKAGKASVQLRLKAPKNKVRAVYLGTARLAGSTSRTAVVTTVRAG